MSSHNATPSSPNNANGATRDSSGVNVASIERVVSTVGGGALALFGLSRRSLGGVALAAAGGGLLYRGVTGHCHMYGALGVSTAGKSGGHGITVERATTINCSPEELYQFWSDFENLPRFMDHLESVSSLSDGRSHWVAKAPLGTAVQWDAEVTERRDNELIAWRSLPGSEIDNSGQVQFTRLAEGRGTEVKVSLAYSPPGGTAGAAVAKLFGENPDQQVRDDLRHFKQLMETGEMPTTDGQSAGNNR